MERTERFENQDIEGGSSTLPNTLQRFLSNVGVVSSSLASSGQTQHMPHSESGSIFESTFDLTPERLKYVFEIFDTDEDGKISYESLRRGFDFSAGSQATLDESSFQQLTRYLDLDGSGDISFEEFSEGLRLLMLRDLFRQPDEAATDTTVEVMDYDRIRLERQMVNEDERDPTTITARKFFFQRRQDWVETRFVNIVGSSAATSMLTMQRIAVKYLLHPLALEDALSPGLQRPKAEMYANHYFIMVPVFFVNREPIPEETVTGVSAVVSWLIPGYILWCLRGFPTHKEREDFQHSGATPTRLSSIGVNMASIFVNVPTSDTIIAFMIDPDKRVDPWRRVQQELELSYSKLRQYDAQYVTYAILDEAVDRIDPILSTVRDEIRDEREHLRSTLFDSLLRINALKAELVQVFEKIKPFTRVLSHVIEDDAISPGSTIYLKDVRDNLEVSSDAVRQLISECEAVEAEAEKAQSRQMDKTLYTLTVISAICLPAQLLTGIYGMNFQHMPELDEPWGYRMFWIVSSLLMISMLAILNFGRVR